METERQTMLLNWLQTQCCLAFHSVKAMTGDASCRKYYRLQTTDRSYIGVDAPPPENCHAFIHIAKGLHQQGLHTPEIINADLEQGFMLVSDLGHTTLLNALTPQTADTLYHAALDTLAVLQSCQAIPDYPLPIFSRELMLNEWAWHKEWFLQKLLGLSFDSCDSLKKLAALDHCYLQLVDSALSQPQALMHRDYHSANLMLLDAQVHPQIGLLDFQDAFIGPITYDLVSLLRDCYIDWPAEKVNAWALYYYAQLKAKKNMPDETTFLRWFDWMGLQRHLKALMTFARKQVRDQQSHYLQYIPRTLNYIRTISACYPELSELHDYYRQVKWPCAQ